MTSGARKYNMTDNKPSNIRNIISKIISLVVQFIVSFAVAGIIVREWGNEGNGYYQLSNDFVTYAEVISVALNSLAARFITISLAKDDNDEVNKYFNTVLFANIFLAASLLIPVIAVVLNLQKMINISDKMIFDVKLLLFFMMLNFLLSIAASVFGVANYARNRIDIGCWRDIESFVLKIIIILVGVMYFHMPIWIIAVASVVSSIYIIIRNVFFTRRMLPDVKPFQWKSFDWHRVKTLVTSGMWNSFTRFGAILLGGLDVLIANLFVSTNAMGMISISKTIPKYILASIAGIATVFAPGIMIAFAKSDKNDMVDRLKRGIAFCSFLAIPMEIAVIAFGERLFRLWMPGQDSKMLLYISIISIAGYVVVLPLEVLWSVFTALNKVRISSIYLMIEAVIVIMTVFFLLQTTDNEMYKMCIIAGVSSVFEIIRGFFFLPVVSAKLIKVPVKTFYVPLLKALVSFAVSLIFSFTLNNIVSSADRWIILIALCLASTVISFGVSFYIVLDKVERRRLYSFFRRSAA